MKKGRKKNKIRAEELEERRVEGDRNNEER
jgi:hypothetical protein